jgi:N,N'-diacetyllegionaminate synthase
MRIEIIAELAQGFEGRPEQARLLLRASAAAGADAAKFQLVYADELATPDYKYYDLFRSLEMPDAVWEELAKYAQELNIALYLDVFGTRSIALAEHVGARALKVHGTDIANVNLLHQIAQTAVPKILLGAGGAFLPEIEQAIHLLPDKEIVILLGFQSYPTPTDANQIARVRMLSDLLSTRNPNVTLGVADHASSGDLLRVALAATALGAGARVFEKHLTLGEVMKMEDHEAALNPDRFAEFVTVVHDCARAYGECNFGMSLAEQSYRKMIQRHVVASRDLTKYSRISPGDLVLKRTSAEQVITDMDQVYKKILKRDLQKNEPILPDDIE